MTHPYFAKARHPRVLAHRGLVSLEGTGPVVWENTAGAFATAHAAGAEYVETDCQVTADGDIILFHDDDLERLVGDARRIDQVRTAELVEIFAPHGGLLTVAELLETFPETRFNIDVKTDAAAAPLGRIVAPHAHRVLLTSFSDARRRRAVDAVMDAGASVRPATSAGRSSMMRVRLLTALRLSPARVLREIDALQIPERYGPVRVLTPSLLRAAHRHDVEVHVWTVNDPQDMRRLVDTGIDGIVTDRADVAIETVN
ncbi:MULTISPECIES: glycerophosphodiester phosphodiesterase family protein [unclassified Microbacterium]|uniref:glycerophosphodiester phosphodiesterase family protein n=1 Tax=unclassified Microbacterium TaxID=2609290 RepID=UPI001DE5B4AB|nr:MULTISPECIES: glycerophosphodiester phosphodiesterase family protein [unclassified Microbacterium]CAH0178618.1 Glycerophosphodiester phosphodiesterase, cytoplasmic [Microbacterium sp. Bi121]HWK77580.1 glycerophosphodiester phosphodiesterase family protein [Microbacterium sp.]